MAKLKRGKVTEIANKTGYTVQYVYKVLHKELTPSPKRAKIIAENSEYGILELLYPEGMEND